MLPESSQPALALLAPALRARAVAFACVIQDVSIMGSIGRLARIALLLCTGLLSVAGARAEDVQIDGHKLKLLPSGHFCALDRNQPAEAWLFDYMKKLQADRTQLVAYWAHCPTLERYRRGETDYLMPYALIMIPMRDGHPRATRQSRAQFVEEMRIMSAGPAFNAGLKEGTKEGHDKLKSALDELGDDIGATIEVPTVQSLGILLSDDKDAVYYGVLERFEIDGKEAVNGAGISAWTVIDGLVVTAVIYDAFTGPESFDLLKQKAQNLVHALLADNR